MRSVVGALVVIVALAGTSTAEEEIYRWKDPVGGLHFENVPAPGRGSFPRGESGGTETSDTSEASPPSYDGSGAQAADAGVDENGQPVEAAGKKKRIAPDEMDSYSTDVSIRRNRLERELRGTESRLREIDGRLATLERARLKNSRGSAATGGVAAHAADVLSPEEASLVEERDDLAQQAVEMRSDGVHLRQEVEARLGTVPSWWTDLR